MRTSAAACVELLRSLGVALDAGLSETELGHLEAELGFSFGPEQRQLLRLALPVGTGWPDWRNGSRAELAERLSRPVSGVLFDVRHAGFWPDAWGPRPRRASERDAQARAHLAEAPRLVPLYSHRYLAADARYRPSPVFSVHQTDVIYYGADLPGYLRNEFADGWTPAEPAVRVPFWSELALS